MGSGPTPQLYLDRLIEEGDTVAVVSRLDTFHVWLGEVPAA
ncbi:hypothetical protein [Mycobacterium sp. AZCC_0083]|nr:hypothetical protein [Mycobacterium sp. AZCC_0083]MBB5160957.1 hypothetical protein [Mycobacterium sp. AZCC_0083]